MTFVYSKPNNYLIILFVFWVSFFSYMLILTYRFNVGLIWLPIFALLFIIWPIQNFYFRFITVTEDQIIARSLLKKIVIPISNIKSFGCYQMMPSLYSADFTIVEPPNNNGGWSKGGLTLIIISSEKELEKPIKWNNRTICLQFRRKAYDILNEKIMQKQS